MRWCPLTVFVTYLLLVFFPGEFLFLLWGVYLCYAVRTIPSAFHEPRYMAVAIYNELLISAIFHIIRWVRKKVLNKYEGTEKTVSYVDLMHALYTTTLPPFLQHKLLVNQNDISSNICLGT